VEVELYCPVSVRSWVAELPSGRILAIDGFPVADLTPRVQQLLLMQHEPGVPVPVVVERDGTEQTIEVTPEPRR